MWLARILIATGVVVTVILAASFYFIPPKFILERELPNYAKGLPSKFKEASIEFNQRVQAEFPLPQMEALLKNKLINQGFDVNSQKKIATIQIDRFPCSQIWMISWTTNINGEVESINGNYNPACL